MRRTCLCARTRALVPGRTLLGLATALLLAACGSASQTGLWLRIVTPDVSITHVRLLIYDATSFSSEPVATIDVPDPPYPEPRRLLPNATEEANQLWVLILAGSQVNSTIRVEGVGFREQREVARGELARLEFSPGQILELADAAGTALLLQLEGCRDEDEDGYCPPSDCDDDPLTGAGIHPGMDESCDGLDNDCDGAADEGCPCNPGDERDCWPQWAADIATVCLANQDPACPCSPGRQQCTDGTWGPCQGLVVPQVEGASIGSGDEEQGVPCTENCRDAQGQPSPCGSEDYSCYASCADALDNDCDGYPDRRDIGCGGCRPNTSRGCYSGPPGTESHPPCHAGIQFCQEDGTWPSACDGEETPMGWSPDNPDGAQEFDHCNGIDDDCDGVTDNVTAAPACSLNQGCCREARKSCVAGAWVDCSSADYQAFAYDTCYDPILGEDHQYFASQEDTTLCDGLDNDCNGTPDDAIDGVCQCQEGWSSPCETSDVGECRPGDWICVDGQVVMDDTCHPAEPELCDNKDNDCDGVTDRNDDARSDCQQRLGNLEHARVIDCLSGQCACACDQDWWDMDGDECNGCEYNCVQTAGSVERCDSRDNNCDGTTDAEDPLATPTTLCPARNQAAVPGSAAAACVSGVCQYTCNSDYGDCNGDLRDPVPLPGENDPSNGCETYLPTADRHCGACGNDCTDDYPNAVGACNAGTCYLDHCELGWGDCNGNPADGCEVLLATSHDHCGGCGNNCGPNAHCTLGACACDNGYANCNGSWSDGCEIDIDDDSNNCGSCGNVCQDNHANNSCSNGTCVPSCIGLWGDCDSSRENGCETPLDTLSDCGQCGRGCSLAHATESCSTGTCVIVSCDAGWGNCNGQTADGCENSLDTLSNCGSCGTTCSRAHATASCSGDSCHIASCDSGWGNCNGVDSDGCENSLDTLSNCGSCGTTCSRAHATPSCSGDVCHIASCDSGWGDCNNVDADGCETDLASTAAHCGACGNSCGANAHCSSSNCACNSGYANCDGNWSNGCEVQLGTMSNCSYCGENCNDGEQCTSDSCGGVSTGCVNTPVGDGTECGSRYCNGFEYRMQTCQSGTCSGNALIENCNDGETCTSDACSPATGCSHTNNDGMECGTRYCDNLQYRRQICSGGTCSASALIENCNDGNVCTTDSCSGNGGCSHVDNTGPCDDGNLCNGSDSCLNGSCSQHAGDPCAPYGDADCAGGCNPADGQCTASEPDGSPCANGTCSSGACSCGGSYTDCNGSAADGCECNTVGNYCNGTSCDPCQVDDHCGGSCTDCSAQDYNTICINRGGGLYSCGCLSNANCDIPMPNCDNATKVCEP